MKKVIPSVLVGFIGIVFLVSFAATPKETVVFHSPDLDQIARTITNYSKAGYVVTKMESQALTNTYGGRTSCGGECQVIKGDIMVVMVK